MERNSVESINELFKEKATNYFNAGSIAFFEKKNAKKALKFYSWGANYLPYDNSLLLMRGLCRYELGDTEGTFEDWNRMAGSGGIDMGEYAGQIAGMKGYDELMVTLKK